MPKPDSSALLSKLKSSLPKPPTGVEAPILNSPPSLEAVSRPKPTKLVNLPTGAGERNGDGLRAPKISVSLYLADLARLDEIKEFMRGMGHRNLSDSEALRLACRAVMISDHFVGFYRQMQREDGRRRVAAKP